MRSASMEIEPVFTFARPDEDRPLLALREARLHAVRAEGYRIREGRGGEGDGCRGGDRRAKSLGFTEQPRAQFVLGLGLRFRPWTRCAPRRCSRKEKERLRALASKPAPLTLEPSALLMVTVLSSLPSSRLSLSIHRRYSPWSTASCLLRLEPDAAGELGVLRIRMIDRLIGPALRDELPRIGIVLGEDHSREDGLLARLVELGAGSLELEHSSCPARPPYGRSR
jgi:hypothetical protein